MRRQRGTSCGDLAGVGAQVALSGGQRAVPGDLAQDVKRDPGVREPRQPGVAQVVPSKVLEAELGDDVVPVGRVAQDSG